MSDEARNTAARWVTDRFSQLGETIRSGRKRRLTDGFTREDRRRLIAMPLMDADGAVESSRVLLEVGAGTARFSVEEIIAVRGERLVLARHLVSYADSGSAIEYLQVSQLDEEMRLMQRMVLFDPDDVKAATEELDLQHAELSERHPDGEA